MLNKTDSAKKIFFEKYIKRFRTMNFRLYYKSQLEIVSFVYSLDHQSRVDGQDYDKQYFIYLIVSTLIFN